MTSERRRGRPYPGIAGALTGVIVLAGAALLSRYMLETATAALLLGAPFLSGFAAAFVHSESTADAPLQRSVGAALVALTVATLGLCAVLHEGAIVVLMAFPPAVVLSVLGALMGHSTVAHGRPSMGPVVALMMCWPLLAAAEAEHNRPDPRVVLSIIEVDRAPAEFPPAPLESEQGEHGEWHFISNLAGPEPAREFRLHELPEGRTRIEARTVYTLDLYPQRYWSLWSDAIIHRMHMQALAEIKRQAEHTVN